jgi:outer membrane protein TolC
MRRFRRILHGVFLIVAISISSASVLEAETLDWSHCLAEAAAHSPDLRSASETLRQAEAQRDITGGGRLPSVSASVGAERSGSSAASTTGAWSYGVSASQLLFDGAKTSNQIRSADQSVSASRFNEQKVSVSTRYALRTAFVQLLTAQEQLSLAGEIASKRRQNLRLIALLYKSGKENVGSLSKAQADLTQAEYEVAQSGRGIAMARTLLCTFLGRNECNDLRVTGQFTPAESPGVTPDFDRIARENPARLNLAAQKDAASYSLEATQSAFAPSLSLITRIGNSSFSQLPPQRTDWQAGLNLSVPIYAGGSGKAGVARARAQFNQLSADEESMGLSLKRTLVQSWKSFVDASDYVAVQKKYLDAAAERARIADAQYSSGLVSFNEWTIIEDALVSAKKSFLNAQSTLLTAEAAWVQAKGGTLEAR